MFCKIRISIQIIGVGMAYLKTEASAEQAKLEKRHSALWRCIGRVKCPISGGYLYQMQPKETSNFLGLNATHESISRAAQTMETVGLAYEHNISLLKDIASYTPSRLRQEALIYHLNNLNEAWLAFCIDKGPLSELLIELMNEFPFLQAESDEDSLTASLLAKNESACYQAIVDLIKVHVNEHMAEDEFVGLLSNQYIRGDVKLLHRLGYQFESDADGNVIWTLPDRKTFLARWEKIRNECPKKDLPELVLNNGKGIADDLEFVESYLKFDALISSGKEFVHDNMFHVTTLVRLITQHVREYTELSRSEQYIAFREQMKKHISDTLDIYKFAYEQAKASRLKLGNEIIKPEALLPLEMALGAGVDSLAGQAIYDEAYFSGDKIIARMIESDATEVVQSLWQQRHSNSPDMQALWDSTRLQHLWAEMVKQYCLNEIKKALACQRDITSWLLPGLFTQNQKTVIEKMLQAVSEMANDRVSLEAGIKTLVILSEQHGLSSNLKTVMTRVASIVEDQDIQINKNDHEVTQHRLQ